MSHERITFSLPPELMKFVEKRITQEGHPQNVSRYMRDLILQDKAERDQEAADKTPRKKAA
jgi:Arc/MetJ-type ribon-helix-helix transcriptional regulator